MGYDDTLLEERRHPTRDDLDRVSTEHPIGIVHVSGHLAVVNTPGLAALGIDADTPDPEGGQIRHRADGEPDGVLEETAARPIAERIFDLSPLEALAVVNRAAELYLSAGVTTAQSGATPAPLIGGFVWLSRLGLLPLRMVVWPDQSSAAAMLDGSLELPSTDPLQLRIGAVKLIADGSIQGYTGYLSRPYHVAPGDDPEYRGYPVIPRDKLMAEIARLHAAGMQIAVHGNGDAAIDDILDAFEAAQAANPRDDARPIVIHAQMTRDDQLDRMRALGVIPSFFSLHTFYWGDRHREIFMGPERAARMSPARSALERGIRFTIHADTPIVPMEPLRLVWSAVQRRTRSGAVVGPDQRIDVMQALRAVTLDAAFQHYEETLKGSLEEGKLADLVVLDRSPIDDPEHIDEIRVVQTIVGGRPVWPR
jgi:predicted amidohydrolase YtcJ